MKGILITLLTEVLNEQPCYTNVKSRDIKIGAKYLIKGGEVCDGYMVDAPKMALDEILEEIEDFYIKKFKVSRPTTKEVNRRVNIFRAKKIDELSQEEYITGLDRNLCRLILEGTLICRLVDGSIYWDSEIMGGNLYWQSKRDSELVLFRKYLGL